MKGSSIYAKVSKQDFSMNSQGEKHSQANIWFSAGQTTENLTSY